MELYWHTKQDAKVANLRTIAELASDDDSLLQDLAQVLMNYTNKYNCPSNFTWKG